MIASQRASGPVQFDEAVLGYDIYDADINIIMIVFHILVQPS